jgi:MFS family permease
MGLPSRHSRIFYGWYIVAASFVILFFNGGARYAFGVMLKPIVEEFGWSRGLVSGVFSLNMIIFALGMTLVGKVYDRYGPKWVIIVSTLFISAGFVLTAFMHSLGQFFFSYGLLAALGVAGTAIPLLATLTSKWFDEWRGLAISLSMSGNAIGQFVLVPVLSFLAVAYSWRTAYLYIGLAMLVVNILLALLVIRGDPHHLGQKPYSRKESDKTRAGSPGEGPGPDLQDLTLKQAMATRSFWLFVVAMFVCGGGDYFAVTHLIAMATDQGITAITAGNMLAWYGGMSLVGILIAAPSADWIGNKTPIVVTFIMRVFLYLLLFRYKTTGAFYVFALGFGFTHLITAPLIPMLIIKIYGSTHLGLLTGFVNTVHYVGAATWPLLAGMLFDKTGNYQLTLIFSAIAAAIAVLCSLFIVEKRHHPGGQPSRRQEAV